MKLILYCLSLLAMMLCPLRSEASIVVFLPTKDGVVVAADKQRRFGDNAQSSADATKVLTVTQDTVLASTGIGYLSAVSEDRCEDVFDTVPFLQYYLREVRPIRAGRLNEQMGKVRAAGTAAFRYISERLKGANNLHSMYAGGGHVIDLGIFHFDAAEKQYQAVICDFCADKDHDFPTINVFEFPPITYATCAAHSFGVNESLLEVSSRDASKLGKKEKQIRRIMLRRDPVNRCNLARGLKDCQRLIRYVHEHNSADVSDSFDAVLLSPSGARSIASNEKIKL